MSKKDNAAVGLAEMLAGLRDELKRSQELSTSSNIKFEVQNIDLELKVHVEKATEGGGNLGVKFWVVNAGVSGKGTKKGSQTQTIKLSMKATDDGDLDEDGKPRNVKARG